MKRVFIIYYEYIRLSSVLLLPNFLDFDHFLNYVHYVSLIQMLMNLDL